jgi:beta-N-acetylhexosaminidase
VEPAYTCALQAAKRGILSTREIHASAQRIVRLKTWIARTRQPPLGVIGCREHRELAREVAQRSVTLVRDTTRQLPLKLPANAKIAVVVPRPEDLTPADTSSLVVPALAQAVRRHHRRVDDFFIPMNPTAPEIRTLRAELAEYDLLILGTINAASHPGQAALVNTMLQSGSKIVAVALRMPYDLTAYPRVPTYVCSYSILPPAMDALADALWGRIPFLGQLPVRIPLNKE